MGGRPGGAEVARGGWCYDSVVARDPPVPADGSASGLNWSGLHGMRSIRLRKYSRLAALAAAAQSAAERRPEVAVTGLDAWAVQPSPGEAARLLLALRTSAGITGYGETAAVKDSASSVSAALRWGEVLEGADAIAGVAALTLLGEAPPFVRGAVDMALLDIRGKLVEAPVYQLLSGRTRDKARAMALLDGSTEEELLGQLEAARAVGFRAFSVQVPLPADTPVRGRRFFGATAALLERLRQAGADDLVLDCGGRTTAAEAAGLAADLEKFHLLWMDEPTAGIADAVLEKISHETVTPLGWGRHLTSAGRFQDLLRRQVVDVLRPDLGLNGITGCRQIAVLAEACYVAVAPYHRGGPLGTAAALQVAASVPNFVVQEVPFTTDEALSGMEEAITRGTAPRVSEGFFQLPTGPGLGVEIDEAALERYRVGA